MPKHTIKYLTTALFVQIIYIYLIDFHNQLGRFLNFILQLFILLNFLFIYFY